MAGSSGPLDRAWNFFLLAAPRLYAGCAPSPAPLARLFLRRRSGQTTVEYMLMLATVVAMTLIIGVLFHKKLLGGMFTMVGLVIGAGSSHR